MDKDRLKPGFQGGEPLGEDALDEGNTLRGSPPFAWLNEPDALPSIETSASAGRPAHLSLGDALGSGGMADVFLGEQPALQREVAVKVPKGAQADVGTRALIREARIVGGLEHPNIVPVHAIGRDSQGRAVLIMKRIEGEAWADVLDRDLPGTDGLTRDRLDLHLDILMQVCNAAHFAHSRGVVHRDLKPANVMIGRYSEVYLLDWGIALNAHEWADAVKDRITGTLGYMAPEMLGKRFGAISPRTDVYQAGALLHRILTGKPRHTGPGVDGALASIAKSTAFVYDNWVPQPLANAANRAMHADPEQRFADVEAFRDALQDYQRHRSSVDLSDAAHRSRVAFEVARRMGKATTAQERVRRFRLLGEARFGYRQALASWPDNPYAPSGLQETLTHLIRWELDHNNPEGARLLLLDLPTPDESLEEAVLDALSQQRERDERLRRLERLALDMDPNAAGRWKALMGAVLALIAMIGPSMDKWMINTGHAESGQALIISSIAITLVSGAGFAMLAGRILVNEANRRLVYLIGVTLAAMWLNRLRGVVAGLSVNEVMVVDPMLFGLCIAAGAITVDRRMWVGVPFFAAASMLATADPGHAPVWLGAGNALALGSIAALWARRDEEAAPNTPL